MAKAKVFMSGNSQAIRVPREFRVTAKELNIERRGREIVLTEDRPKSTAYGRRLVRLIQQIPPEFADIMETLDDPPVEPVEGLG
jgi:antitoxin VapB